MVRGVDGDFMFSSCNLRGLVVTEKKGGLTWRDGKAGVVSEFGQAGRDC